MNPGTRSFLLTTALLVSAVMLRPFPASAQFYSLGEDPGRIRWNVGKTDHFRIIYPVGMDSIAACYGLQFEKYTRPEAISSGLSLKDGKRRKFPIILHPYHGISNASVTWAPKRLDVFTLPDAYDPEPLPWIENLAVHEGRHIAQMQFGYRGWLKPLAILLGDMAPGAYSALWPNTWMLEGDAVVAETALTGAGRGRSADFLEYYRAAFAKGDWRNWTRWRYGSYRRYAPDHYALGYLTLAGARYCFGDSLYTERYFDRMRTNPFRFGNTRKTMKAASGMGFRQSFDVIMRTFNEMWEEEAAAREPFIPSARVSGEDRWYRELRGSVMYDGRIYGILTGLPEACSLVEVNPDDGSMNRLRAFSGNTGRLSAGNGRLWWSETLPDERWSLEMDSAIRYYDISSGRTGTLVRRGRLFNPVPSPDGQFIAAVSLPAEGGSSISVLDARSGAMVRNIRIPGGLQAAEVCYVGNELYFSAVSDEGCGIYRVSDIAGEPAGVAVRPLPVSIRNLRAQGGNLRFACDRTGTNEYYEYDTTSGEVLQLTSLRNGGSEFCGDGDYLYYTVQTGDDKMLHRTACRDLMSEVVDYEDIHRYRVADELSSQEEGLAMRKGIGMPGAREEQFAGLQDVKRYRKAGHLLRIHSWAPVYFNYDRISSSSADYNYEYACAGATALFQNDLGTFWGSIGYGYHKDPYSYAYGGTRHRHSGHLNLTYTGLYPVLELSADINDRAAIQYRRRDISAAGEVSDNMYGSLLSVPYVEGRIRAYIPFNFTSGGWQRGLIPQVEYKIGNDWFDKAVTEISYDGNFDGSSWPVHLTGYRPGSNVLMQKLTASVRGYVMRPTASSAVYPRMGIGAEVGMSARTGLSDMFTPAFYGYVYGYLPGITRTQGLKITAMYQHRKSEGIFKETVVDMSPRGFNDSGADYYIRQNSRNNLKLSVDYAIPVYVGDINWFSPLVYVRSFEVTPHFDFTMFSEGKSLADGNLFSAGARIVARFANLLWIPYDCSIGVTVDWNGGSASDRIKNSGCRMDSHYVGFVFNMSL